MSLVFSALEPTRALLSSCLSCQKRWKEKHEVKKKRRRGRKRRLFIRLSTFYAYRLLFSRVRKLWNRSKHQSLLTVSEFFDGLEVRKEKEIMFEKPLRVVVCFCSGICI